MTRPPSADFFCPVCAREVDSLWVWLEPDSPGERARIFCASCAELPAYAGLPCEERRQLDRAGFGRWAGARLLRHVFQKEHRE